MNHGELFWVDLPDRGGREQRGRRPAIIWQDTEAFSGLPTILTIPLTSRLGAVRFPATLRIEPSPANGLTTPSIALLFQIGACDVRRIQNRLGRLDEQDVGKIIEIIKRLQQLG